VYEYPLKVPPANGIALCTVTQIESFMTSDINSTAIHNPFG